MPVFDKYVFRENCCTATLIDADTTRNTLRIDGPCIYCRKPQSVIAPAAAIVKFGQGGYAQECFADLTPDQREFLLSGICGECWNKMFPAEDADE